MKHTCPLMLAAFLFASVPASAQQRPLVTEDPETVGGGRVLVEVGAESGRDQYFPASGLTGDLLRFPIGISIGLSSIAELQIDGGFYQRLTVTERNPLAPLAFKLDFEGDHTTDVEDLVLATKLRLVSEGVSRPGFGIRLATKLPNAGNESG
ncbi:MAG TPA: hypothetical protein VIL35_08055, partial [Vicinamibacterales bacterium]